MDLKKTTSKQEFPQNIFVFLIGEQFYFKIGREKQYSW